MEKHSKGFHSVSAALAQEMSEKLLQLGGGGGRFSKSMVRPIMSRLKWWDTGADNRIRHLIYREQKPTPEQVRDVRRAYIKYRAERLAIERRENNAILADNVRTALEAMQHSDPDFFARDIEAHRALLRKIDDMGGEQGAGD